MACCFYVIHCDGIDTETPAVSKNRRGRRAKEMELLRAANLLGPGFAGFCRFPRQIVPRADQGFSAARRR